MKRIMRKRVLFAGFFITTLFVSLMGRVYWIQVADASMLVSEARGIWEASKTLLPERGKIYDRNGQVLAQDGAAYTVAVNPELIHAQGTEQEVINLLAPILNMNDSEGLQKLMKLVTKKRDDGSYLVHVEIRNEGWKIDTSTAKQIETGMQENGLQGIYLMEEKKRYYPAKQLASHLLGYTTLEGKPAMGLELTYDDVLKGTPGHLNYERDRLGYGLPNSEAELVPPQNGNSLKLTIDEKIQLYVEQALAKAYQQFHPKSISAIAANPQTMEILAMANFPTYDPNDYSNFESWEDFKNRSILSTYEPGSTFKIVTLAAAVEEGIFNPDDHFQSGSIYVPGGTIHDHNYVGWGEVSYLTGLLKSSNVAFVKLGYEQLGAEKLRSYIDAFGFGSLTGIDIDGEAAGNISFRDWIPTEVATATFGQGGVQVTTLQQIVAMSAIANGGLLMQPYVVKEIIDSETGEVIQKNEPKTVRRVISESTAKEVAQYLEMVISDEEGTGHSAYLEGYRMAGKTGTAQKVVNGEYSMNGQYIISFSGFAPVENPEIALIIVADEPDLDGDYRNGGKVTAPVFQEIMLKSLRYLGVKEDAQKQGAELEEQSINVESATVPDVVGKNAALAANEIEIAGLSYEFIGNGNQVLAQIPEEGTEMIEGQQVYVLTESPSEVEVPDLTGKSLRDALQIASLLELKTTFEGEGYVTSQEVSGTSDQRSIHLILQPIRDTYVQSETTEESDEGEQAIEEQQ